MFNNSESFFRIKLTSVSFSKTVVGRIIKNNQMFKNINELPGKCSQFSSFAIASNNEIFPVSKKFYSSEPLFLFRFISHAISIIKNFLLTNKIISFLSSATQSLSCFCFAVLRRIFPLISLHMPLVLSDYQKFKVFRTPE